MSTTFSVLVDNKFWVLTRISRLFSRHMFNIQSLTVAPTLDPEVSCMTIDVAEEPERLRRIELELKKLVNVRSVQICQKQDYVETEMVLVRIQRANPSFKEFIRQVENYQGRVVFRNGETEVVEFSGDRDTVERFLETALANGVQDIVRTGTVAIYKRSQKPGAKQRIVHELAG